MKVFCLEFFKCRRRKIGLLCLVFVLAQTAWMGVSFSRMEAGELASGWRMLAYNLTLLDAIMLPLTVSAIASRSGELEHKGSTLKLLETMVPPGKLFAAKLGWGAVLLAGTLLLRTAVLTAAGLLRGFPAEIPFHYLLGGVGISFAVTFVIFVLQQSLSLRFANQAIPLAVGIFGSFVGLMSLFFPQWVQRCVIWGYYGVLAQVWMDWDPVTRISEYVWISPQPQDFGLLALWFLAVLVLGRRAFVRKEV